METKLILTLIPKIMGEVGAIGKNRQNKQQGYAFRGIDDVYLALQGLLASNQVIVVPSVIEHQREERQTKTGSNLIYTILKMKFTFMAPDGSYFEAVTIGEAMDSGDKSANKAMSTAMKYAMLQVFCIPTEEPKDTEYESHEVKPKKQEAKSYGTIVPDNTVSLPGGDTPLDFNAPEFEEKKTPVEKLLEAAKVHKWAKENIRSYSEKRFKNIPSKLGANDFEALYQTVASKSFTSAMTDLVHAGDVK